MMFYLQYYLVAGADNEGPWFLPDILVNIRRPGDDAVVGVIKDVLPVYSFDLNRKSLHVRG